MYYIIYMHISQGNAKLNTYLLGPHPIIAHFLQRLELRSIVSSHVGTGRERLISHGEALCSLVHNILDSPEPLYRIASWAEPYAAHSFTFSPEQKRALNDDRIARMLDALVSERGRGIWFDLALRIIRQFKVTTERMHQDTTTITFHGGYSGSVQEPRIAHGHNKDHRPDLKQLVFGLTVSADGAVPIHHQVHSGNKTDDRIHQGNLEQLRQILGRNDFIYVADGKLATHTNLMEIQRHGGKFVTVLPRTRREDSEFRKTLRRYPVRWKKLLSIPNKRDSNGPADIFYTCSTSQRTQEGFRFFWIRSSAKALQDEANRHHALQQTLAKLSDLNTRLNRRALRSPAKIRQAIAKITHPSGMQAFIQVKLQCRVQKEFKHFGRGRPAPNAPVRVLRKTIWALKAQPDKKALSAEKRLDGVFPLATNLYITPKKEILQIYKYQPYVEKRFSQIKTDLEIAPVYLKKSLRCAGLVHAYFVALAVASLIERSVRQGMMQQNIKALPLFPEKRATSTPTCARILDAFRGVQWHEFKRGDERVCFPIKLNQLQKTLLKLLEVPVELYR